MQPESTSLEQLARRALAGEREAVRRLVLALQGDVHGLALRMLWQREDAEDATQEILVRVITRLSQYDFRSRLKTWVYRVATNYLLDVKKSAVERLGLDFEQLAQDLATGLSDRGPGDGERSLLTLEVKIGCTLAMLQCLDRPHRLAYVLGEILDLSSAEAAEALAIDPASFRKRLERARARIAVFAERHCGLVSDQASCRCNRRVPAAIRLGRADPDRLQFAAQPRSFSELRAVVQRVEAARRAAELLRAGSSRGASVDFAKRVIDMLEPRPPD